MAREFAGLAYEELIREQLSEERARKVSLQQRGLAVVTSSGTLVTLLFAIGAVAIDSETFELPALARVFFTLALVAFATAGILGILTNRPDLYEEVDVAWLDKTLKPIAWNYDDVALARRRASEARVRSIESFRNRNPRHVSLLTRAITAEVVAVGFVGIGIAIVLFS